MAATETAPAPAQPVVLEIGGEYGAAVLVADGRRVGREVEIRAAGTDWDGRHVAFHPRLTGEGTVVAAVFPGLLAGTWQVRLIGEDTVTDVVVAPARVTTVTVPAAEPATYC